MRPSRLAACSLSLVALLILSGCDFRPRGFTNDVDEARLAALADEPLFEGATTEVGGEIRILPPMRPWHGVKCGWATGPGASTTMMTTLG